MNTASAGANEPTGAFPNEESSSARAGLSGDGLGSESQSDSREGFDLQGTLAAAGQLVKDYPGFALLGAAAVGFLAAQLLAGDGGDE